MIIVDPVALGDVSFTRASDATYWDKDGVLQTAPPNTLRVTYDPSDLSKAPYALIEAEAKNLLVYSEQFDNIAWGKTNAAVVANSGTAPDGSANATLLREATATSAYIGMSPNVSQGDVISLSVFVKLGSGNRQLALIVTNPAVGINQIAIFDLASLSAVVVSGAPQFSIVPLPNGWARCSIQVQAIDSGQIGVQLRLARENLINYQGDGVSGNLIWGAMLSLNGLSSYVKTTAAPVTRAADVVGPGAGLVYSNVPITEPPYSATTTYALDAAVHDPVTKIVYWSMVAGNVGNPLSDPSKWNKRTAVNRWAMFDDRNSTQTSNADEIIAVVSARAITQGMFAGALDASEVLVSMTHPTRGMVYSEARNLVLPRSGSSFFGWCFNRLRMRTWFLTLKLPVFANALVTITIRRPGGVAKCGMCMIGPAIDVGLSLMGLSTELKDYSTTTFYPDGSSDTIPRGFSKRMSIDLSVERDRVETIEDDLIKRRQKTLVWLGSTMRGDTMLVGKFSSFRKVIDSYPRSKMALQIEGVLSQ